MYNTVSGESGYFLACVLTGIGTAFLYDFLRISRRIVKASDSAVNIQDILFLALVSVGWFAAAYIKNGGEVRVYGLIGGICGVFGYILLVRNRVVDIGSWLVKWVISILIQMLKIVFFPIRLIMKALKKPVNIVVWYTGRSLARIKRIFCHGGFKMRIGIKNMKSILKNRR